MKKKYFKLLMILLLFILIINSCSYRKLNFQEFNNNDNNTILYEKKGKPSLLIQKELFCKWGVVTLTVRSKTKWKDMGLAHLFEHLILRKLRKMGQKFIISAYTNEHSMTFKCEFLPGDARQALILLFKNIFSIQTWSRKEILQSLSVLEYEKLQNVSADIPKNNHYQERLGKFQKKYFKPEQIFLYIISSCNIKDIKLFIYSLKIDKFYEADKIKERTDITFGLKQNDKTFFFIGPGLKKGTFQYFQFLTYYMSFFMTHNKKVLANTYWQINPQYTKFIFFPKKNSQKIKKQIARKLICLHDREYRVLKSESFLDIKKKLLGDYYFHFADKKLRITAITKAWTGYYLKDLINYPYLLQKASLKSFIKWLEYYFYPLSPNSKGSCKKYISDIIAQDSSFYVPGIHNEIQFKPVMINSTLNLIFRNPGSQWAGIGLYFFNKNNNTNQYYKYYYFTKLLKFFIIQMDGIFKFEELGGHNIAIGIVQKNKLHYLINNLKKEMRDFQINSVLRNFVEEKNSKFYLWKKLCNKVLCNTTEKKQLESRFMISVSANFSMPELEKYSTILTRAFRKFCFAKFKGRMNHINKKVNISELAYLCGGTKIVKNDFFYINHLSVIISELLYKNFVIPGNAYQAVSFYQYFGAKGILAIYIVSYQNKLSEAKAKFKRILENFSGPANFEMKQLMLRSRLYCLKKHYFSSDNFLYISRQFFIHACFSDLKQLKKEWEIFQDIDFSFEKRIFQKYLKQYFNKKAWLFFP